MEDSIPEHWLETFDYRIARAGNLDLSYKVTVERPETDERDFDRLEYTVAGFTSEDEVRARVEEALPILCHAATAEDIVLSLLGREEVDVIIQNARKRLEKGDYTAMPHMTRGDVTILNLKRVKDVEQ